MGLDSKIGLLLLSEHCTLFSSPDTYIKRLFQYILCRIRVLVKANEVKKKTEVKELGKVTIISQFVINVLYNINKMVDIFQ
jgi:hypothetical protein